MLTDAQKKFYQDNGYVLVDNIYTPEEIEQCSREYDRLFRLKQDNNLEAAWEGNWKKEKDVVSVSSLHNLQFHSALFTRLITKPALAEAVADIMGTPNVLLHHTKAHVKPPGKGAPYPTHQDYHYFPFEKHSMVAAFIHFDDTTPENGGLAVYPGSHKLGPLPDFSDSPLYHYVDQDKFPVEKATPVVAKKGQVVIFSYLLVHGSYINRSPNVRRMLLVQMMSAEDKPTEDVHRSPAQGLVLGGCNLYRESDFNKKFEH